MSRASAAAPLLRAATAAIEAFAAAVSRRSSASPSSSAAASFSSSSAAALSAASPHARCSAAALARREVGGTAASWARRSMASCLTTTHSVPPTSTTTKPRLQRRHQHSDAASATRQQTPGGLRLTPAAVERVRFLLEKRKKKHEADGGEGASAPRAVLRLTVEAGGCSGFSYVFAIDDAGPRRGDRAFGEEGPIDDGDGDGGSGPDRGPLKRPLLAVDPVSFGLVEGATVDFEQELIKAGFEVIDNPNAEAGCGCGSSFAVKSF